MWWDGVVGRGVTPAAPRELPWPFWPIADADSGVAQLSTEQTDPEQGWQRCQAAVSPTPRLPWGNPTVTGPSAAPMGASRQQPRGDPVTSSAVAKKETSPLKTFPR